MGKLIPFKQKQSSEEKSLRKRLQINPDDLETLGKILVLKIQQGKFSPESDYAEGILRCIETNDVEQINKFLHAIAPIVEEMDWSEPLPPEFKKQISKIAEEANRLLLSGKLKPPGYFKKIKEDLYQHLYRRDKFLVE